MIFERTGNIWMSLILRLSDCWTVVTMENEELRTLTFNYWSWNSRDAISGIFLHDLIVNISDTSLNGVNLATSFVFPVLNSICAHFPGRAPNSTTVSLNCSTSTLPGRYVAIIMPFISGQLVLCEVGVYVNLNKSENMFWVYFYSTLIFQIVICWKNICVLPRSRSWEKWDELQRPHDVNNTGAI